MDGWTFQKLAMITYFEYLVLIIRIVRRWDHGGRNSYRMGAEGKFDLKVVSGGATEGAKPGRKSHSTPSLPDATGAENQVTL